MHMKVLQSCFVTCDIWMMFALYNMPYVCASHRFIAWTINRWTNSKQTTVVRDHINISSIMEKIYVICNARATQRFTSCMHVDCLEHLLCNARHLWSHCWYFIQTLLDANTGIAIFAFASELTLAHISILSYSYSNSYMQPDYMY